MGPIGIALIAISALFLAWESNLFGIQFAVRDTIKWLQEMYEVIKLVIPQIGLIDAAFKSLDPEGYARGVEDFTNAVDGIGSQFEETGDIVEGVGTQFQAYDTTLRQGVGTVDQFTNSVVSLNNGLAGTSTEIEAVRLGLAKVLGPETTTIFNQARTLTEQLERDTTAFIRNYQTALASGPVGSPEFRLRIAEITGEFEALFKTHAIAGTDNKLAELVERENRAYGIQNDILRTNNRLLDENSKKNDLSGNSNFPNINDIRAEAARLLNEELSTVRVSSGRLIGLAEQELNFRARTVLNRVTTELRFQAAQVQSFAEGRISNAFTSIATFNARSNNNFRNPDFLDGGGFTTTPSGTRRAPNSGGPRRSGGGGVGRYSEQRYQARNLYNYARSQYRQFFGEETTIQNSNPRRGLTSAYYRARDRILEQIRNAQEQFERFPVELDFAVQSLRTRVGTRQVRYGGNRGRFGGSRSRSRTVPVFGDVDRTPTRPEAIRLALARSQEIEGVYTEGLGLSGEDIDARIRQIRLTRDQLYGYKQNDQDLIDFRGKLTFYDRIELESTVV